MSLIASYSSKLAELLPMPGADQFPVQLIALLAELVPFDDATIIVYPANGLPVVEYFQPREDGSSRLDQFVNAAFLLDPYYQAGEKRQFGFFRLRELIPEGFRKSEYYKTFYNQSGYQDECGYLVRLGDKSFANISLARTSKPARFTEKQVALLSDITPVVNSLCQQCWGTGRHSKNTDIDLRAQLGTALESFGSSLLTEREVQVINLVLHGYSTRMVAEKLNISIETVKLHRKHSYAKLGVASQAELFYLFLDSVMSAKNYQGGDTLESYLQPPKNQ